MWRKVWCSWRLWDTWKLFYTLPWSSLPCSTHQWASASSQLHLGHGSSGTGSYLRRKQKMGGGGGLGTSPPLWIANSCIFLHYFANNVNKIWLLFSAGVMLEHIDIKLWVTSTTVLLWHVGTSAPSQPHCCPPSLLPWHCSQPCTQGNSAQGTRFGW